MSENNTFSKVPQLTKEVVKRICSFFHSFESTRGYDKSTPIGEIADHAFHHWDSINKEMNTLRVRVQTLSDNNQLLKISNESLLNENTQLRNANAELRSKLAWFDPNEVEPIEGSHILCQRKVGDDSYFIGWYHSEYKEVWNSPYDNDECSKTSMQDVSRYKYLK